MSNINLNSSLNDLLEGDFGPGRFLGSYLFESASIELASLRVVGFDVTTGLGLAESERTGYRVAFLVTGDAKPLAKRDYRAELTVDVREIETVASPEGIILGALGESRGRGWRVVA